MSQATKLQEIWPSDYTGAKYGLLVVGFSALAFYLASILTTYFRPKITDKQTWRWKNISVSWIHAAITGVWSIIW